MASLTYIQALDVAITNLNADFPEVADKLCALKASLAKRSSGERKPTKTQKENVGVKANINDFLQANFGEQFTATEIANEVGITTQKASALLKQMVEIDHWVEKVIEGRKTYFRAVEGV